MQLIYYLHNNGPLSCIGCVRIKPSCIGNMFVGVLKAHDVYKNLEPTNESSKLLRQAKQKCQKLSCIPIGRNMAVSVDQRIFLMILLLLRLRPEALCFGLRLANKIRLSQLMMGVRFTTSGPSYVQ